MGTQYACKNNCNAWFAVFKSVLDVYTLCNCLLTESRTAYFTSASVSRKDRFINQINFSFGSGGMDTWLSDRELSEFLNFLKSHAPSLPRKKAATLVGQQPGTNVWVFGNDLIFNDEGDEVADAGYVWLNQSQLEDSAIPSDDLLPRVSFPLSTKPLTRLNALLKVCSKHNYNSSLLVIGGVVMSLHFRSVVEEFSGCPIIVALGPPETGKTTAIRAGLSLVGVKEHYVKGTQAFFRQRAAMSTLPFGIDDPPQVSRNSNLDINDLIIDLYNGGKTADLKRGSVKPYSLPVIATNFPLKPDDR